MKPNPGETYESWAERVRLFEYGRALQRLSAGDPIEEVLSSTAHRIQQKMMYPILQGTRNLVKETSTYDSKQSQQNYYKNYLKNNKPRADQMDGTFFDKDE